MSDLLPIGTANFKFLLSGDLHSFTSALSKTIQVRSLAVPPFTLDDTTRYFSGLVQDAEVAKEIHITCKGVPANLSSAKRLLQTGTNLASLRHQMPTSLSGWFEMEWTHVDRSDDIQSRALAVIAFSRHQCRIDDIAIALKLDSKVIASKFDCLPFLHVSEVDKSVVYTSEAYRSFATKKLSPLREAVDQLIIDSLLEQKSSDRAMAYLPAYLESAGRYDDLIEYLSPDHIESVFQQARTLGPVQQSLDYGIRSARKVERTADLFRFSLERAIIAEISVADVLQSEVEARMALGQYGIALALAQTAVFKEDRLQLLAVVAKMKRIEGLPPEPELQDEIKRLFEQVDYAALAARGNSKITRSKHVTLEMF